jgi:hypothetical protein
LLTCSSIELSQVQCKNRVPDLISVQLDLLAKDVLHHAQQFVHAGFAPIHHARHAVAGHLRLIAKRDASGRVDQITLAGVVGRRNRQAAGQRLHGNEIGAALASVGKHRQVDLSEHSGISRFGAHARLTN